MKQLTGLDAGFLYMETATTFGHVSGLLIFERPSAPSIHSRSLRRFASLLDPAGPLRRRLVEVPF